MACSMAICREFDDFNYIANVARVNAASLAVTRARAGASEERWTVTTRTDQRLPTLKWDANKEDGPCGL